ncbi:DUF1573 domain-containing protein [Candidatus Woesearchaeota archaeon]|nr:DUF1573 domain-containing protein [Candidatus Woesearchaeota archaeon]
MSMSHDERQLKKEQQEMQHELEKQLHERARKKKLAIRVGIALIILAAGGYLLSLLFYPPGAPLLDITPAILQMGTVSQAEGIATGTFQLKNTGFSDLLITGMDTSCMCTQVALVTDKEGPRFGMPSHGNPKGWTATIAPGEQATLNVYYDPNAHKELTGPVTRLINIYSNAPFSPKQIQIRLNQVR